MKIIHTDELESGIPTEDKVELVQTYMDKPADALRELIENWDPEDFPSIQEFALMVDGEVAGGFSYEIGTRFSESVLHYVAVKEEYREKRYTKPLLKRIYDIISTAGGEWETTAYTQDMLRVLNNWEEMGLISYDEPEGELPQPTVIEPVG